MREYRRCPADSPSFGFDGRCPDRRPDPPERRSPARLLPGQRDGVDVAPVVALLAVGRAAVTEEPPRIRIGAMVEILDAVDAGSSETGDDITGKIEQGVLRRRRGPEESFVRHVCDEETGDEFGADLVIRLADRGTERDRDTGPIRSAALHGGDRCFENAAGGAAPPGMGRADDAGRPVAEQDARPVAAVA